MSVQQFADLLRQLHPDTTSEDIRDILWLAPRVRPRPSQADGHDGGSRSPPTAEPPSPARADVRGQPPDVPLRPPEQDHTLHLPGPAASVGRQAAPVRVPAALALPDRLGLGRALRPLKRRTPSRHRFQLDEQATADKIADGGLWLPAMRAAPERWLELAVVVDGYESMSIWRQLTREFREVLEQLGAFRDVRFWVLDRVGRDPSRPSVRRWRPGAPPRSTGELTDPAGRRAIMVISDCVGPLWRSGAAQRMLAGWGTHQPVAIIQPLPQRLWAYTHARPVPVTLHAGWPGMPNARLAVSTTAEPALPATGTVPVPVLELDAAWLASWSSLVGTSAPAGVSALAVLCHPGPDSSAQLGTPGAGRAPRRSSDARQVLQRFRASASPEAFQLASYLAAAAPISLPVIQIIQQKMLETPRQSQLAEVFLGGLLRRADPGTDTDPDAVHYEFVTDEVRELLLKQLGRSDIVRVLLVVSTYLDVHFGQARDFRALLAGQDIAGDHLIGPDSHAFALIAERLLRLMGGRYIVPADRLAKAMLPVTGARPAATEISRIRDRAHPLAEIVIPFFGCIKAGKTQLMYTLTSALSDLATETGGTVLPADDANRDEIERLRARMSITGSPGPTTPRSPEALVLRASFGPSERNIYLFDAAGELHYRPDRLDEMRYLDKAKTLVFVADPLAADGIWARLSADQQREYAAIRSDWAGVELAYELPREQIRRMGGKGHAMRLAFVVTKADVLAGTRVRAQFGSVREMVVDPDGMDLGNIAREAEQSFGHVDYLETAATTGEEAPPHESVEALARHLLDAEGIRFRGR